MVATAGRGLGGPIGGYLADTIGWRWSFLGQCPPTLLAMMLTWCIIPNHSHVSKKESLQAKLARVDFLGALLLVSTISVFLLPLELVAEIPWANPVVLGSLGFSIVLFILFVLVETLWAKEPILVPRLLVSTNILVPNIITFCQAAAQLGVCTTSVIYPQGLLTLALIDDVYCSNIFSGHSRCLVDSSRITSISSSAWSCCCRPLWWIHNEKVLHP
jgi:MFS family permease